jgi:hypothetical protein
MDGHLFRVRAATFEVLVARDATDVEYIDEFLFGDEAERNHAGHLRLEADWHALHVLLTGSHELTVPAVEAIESPLKFLVGGGVSLGRDGLYHGFPNLVVESIHEELASLDERTLRARWDPRIMYEDVYPNHCWTLDGEWSLKDLLKVTLPRLREFVQAAAASRTPLISFINGM